MTLVVSQLTVIENAVLISFYGEEATTSSHSMVATPLRSVITRIGGSRSELSVKGRVYVILRFIAGSMVKQGRSLLGY